MQAPVIDAVQIADAKRIEEARRAEPELETRDSGASRRETDRGTSENSRTFAFELTEAAKKSGIPSIGFVHPDFSSYKKCCNPYKSGHSIAQVRSNESSF